MKSRDQVRKTNQAARRFVGEFLPFCGPAGEPKLIVDVNARFSRARLIVADAAQDRQVVARGRMRCHRKIAPKFSRAQQVIPRSDGSRATGRGVME